jgi:hypothetical protein
MTLLAAAGVVFILVLGKSCATSGEMKGQDSNRSKAAPLGEGPATAEGFDDLSIGQQYKTSVASQGHRVATLEQELGSLKRYVEDLKGQLSKANASQENQLSRLDGVTKLLQDAASGPGNHPGAPGALADGARPETVETRAPVRLVAFENPERPKAAPARLVRIPAASAGEATLMNGVFAATSGEPSPVRFRLDAALVGPSHSRVPLTSGFLIGKASGNANASRVHVEVISFSYVKPSGESVEVPVRGYVEGEDGMEGVPGTYLYRIEDQLPLVVLGEGASGFANALANGQTTQSITPLGGAVSMVSGNTLKFGGLKAAAGTSQKIADIFAERMREIHPAVWTPAFGRVKVVFLEGVTLPDFLVLELKDGDTSPFRGLDLHR